MGETLKSLRVDIGGEWTVGDWAQFISDLKRLYVLLQDTRRPTSEIIFNSRHAWRQMKRLSGGSIAYVLGEKLEIKLEHLIQPLEPMELQAITDQIAGTLVLFSRYYHDLVLNYEMYVGLMKELGDIMALDKGTRVMELDTHWAETLNVGIQSVIHSIDVLRGELGLEREANAQNVAKFRRFIYKILREHYWVCGRLYQVFGEDKNEHAWLFGLCSLVSILEIQPVKEFQVRRIRYASPGSIDIIGIGKAIEEIRKTIEYLIEKKNQDVITDLTIQGLWLENLKKLIEIKKKAEEMGSSLEEFEFLLKSTFYSLATFTSTRKVLGANTLPEKSTDGKRQNDKRK